jgi:hypothetical protein
MCHRVSSGALVLGSGEVGKATYHSIHIDRDSTAEGRVLPAPGPLLKARREEMLQLQPLTAM